MIRRHTAGTAARASILAAFTALLSGCVVGPDFLEPVMSLPESYSEGSYRAAPVKTDVAWWRGLDDATLNSLVDRGLAQNLDISVALERITAARENVAAAGLDSQFSGNATASSIASGSSGTKGTRTDTAKLDATFVFDLFGGRRRSREQALANLDAAQFDAATARLAFLTDLVGSYIDARYYQEALELTRQTIASRKETLRLARERRDIGAATELDVAQTEAEVASAESNLPSLESNFRANVYHVATLLAEPAEPLVRKMQRGAPQPHPPYGTEAGVPADLVRNRPDIRSAEASLAAASAAIGIAEAELYPSLTLSGSITVTADTDAWQFGPTLKFPVLGRESLKANRNAAVSKAKQAELSWRGAVLDAVEEVQAAQTAYLRARRTVAAASATVKSREKARDLARAAYEGGTSTILDLLESERTVASARLSLASAIQSMAKQWVTLQIAAGKGWDQSLVR